MTHITLNQLDSQLTERLQQRASQNGRTDSHARTEGSEDEIAVILASVLTPESPRNATLGLATAIQQHFADIEDFEIPEILREPIRMPPNFEEPQ